jgi:hypothetical protein
MWKAKVGWVKLALILAGIALACSFLVVPASIVYNGTVRAGAAQKIAESLHQRHPNLDFAGSAGVEGARLGFSVRGAADEKARREIMDFIEEQVGKRGGHEWVLLTFKDDRHWNWMEFRYQPLVGWQVMTPDGREDLP